MESQLINNNNYNIMVQGLYRLKGTLSIRTHFEDNKIISWT